MVDHTYSTSKRAKDPVTSSASLTVSLPAIARGVAIIFLFLEGGNFIARQLALPLPGNVLGMVLLSLALGTGILPLFWVRDASRLLLHHLSLFFVPVGVGLLAHRELLAGHWLTLTIVILVGTILTLLGTAWVFRARMGQGKRPAPPVKDKN